MGQDQVTNSGQNVLDSSGNWALLDQHGTIYEQKCNPKYFCQNPREIRWHRDESSPVTLDNFINKYDLDCSGHLVISSFGMLFFAGFAMGSLIIPSWSDQYGRKKFFIGALVTNLACFILLLVVPAHRMEYAYFIVFLFFV